MIHLTQWLTVHHPIFRRVLWPCIYSVLDDWFSTCVANAPTRPKRDVTPEWILYADSSSDGWGAVAYNATSGALLTDNGRWRDATRLHINVKEILAVRNAVAAFKNAVGDSPVLLFTDNLAARATIRRGFGKSFALNVALRRLHDARLTWTDVKYIASAANPADEPSRGVSVSAAKLLEHLQQLTSVEGVGGIQLPVTGLVAHDYGTVASGLLHPSHRGPLV